MKNFDPALAIDFALKYDGFEIRKDLEIQFPTASQDEISRVIRRWNTTPVGSPRAPRRQVFVNPHPPSQDSSTSGPQPGPPPLRLSPKAPFQGGLEKLPVTTK